MAHRCIAAIVVLIATLILTLPAEAQQKSVGPSSAGPRPNAVRPYFACAAAMPALPPRAQQETVAAGFSPARADVAASLPRHGGVKPPLRYAALQGGATTPGINPAKPFTQEQVSNMVRDGFGDESGAKLIEQRGIDFAPSEDFIQTLKGAGASEAFLNALRAAKPPEPASAKKPINQVQVFALLVGQVPSHRVTMLVEERGIDFEPTDDYLQEVRLAGGEDELISALKSAKVTKPATVDPAAQARQAEVRQHAAHGAELMQAKRYADAEAEYRAALRLDPQNADLHVSLGIALGSKGDGDGATAEFRHVLRSDPNNERAHVGLGIALGEMGDRDGEIAEEREALRLNPNDESAHHSLGVALDKKGDLQGALQEYREAYALAPQDPLFKDAYETYLKKVNDAHNLEKVQHWLGKWVFAGPVKASTGCNGTMFPLTVDLAEQYFEVLTISPAGEVTAWLDHPVEADQKVWGRPYWSGIATETTLVLTLNPMASGTLLLGGFTLRYAVGRLEARRDGDRYSVEFSYAESHSDNPMPKHGCRDYEDDKRFLGEMKRP